MATIPSINIPNADVDVLARSLNYQPTIDGQANPQSEGVFCKQFIVELLKERIRNQKRQDAIIAANIQDPDIT